MSETYIVIWKKTQNPAQSNKHYRNLADAEYYVKHHGRGEFMEIVKFIRSEA